jgi:hypothetical protein
MQSRNSALAINESCESDLNVTIERLVYDTKDSDPHIGRIRLDVFKKEWSPILTVSSVLFRIQSFMSDPNEKDLPDPQAPLHFSRGGGGLRKRRGNGPNSPQADAVFKRHLPFIRFSPIVTLGFQTSEKPSNLVCELNGSGSLSRAIAHNSHVRNPVLNFVILDPMRVTLAWDFPQFAFRHLCG